LPAVSLSFDPAKRFERLKIKGVVTSRLTVSNEEGFETDNPYNWYADFL